ncbi:Uncharacterized protein GBIM_18964 [Gryllus bimaculatus]|nr:Uncharacterized protein GBIM_18964 [Gryllus bimaculatus]
MDDTTITPYSPGRCGENRPFPKTIHRRCPATPIRRRPKAKRVGLPEGEEREESCSRAAGVASICARCPQRPCSIDGRGPTGALGHRRQSDEGEATGGQLVEPASPQPSVDRLSVTFAPEERSVCSEPFSPPPLGAALAPAHAHAHALMAADKVRFSRAHPHAPPEGEGEEADEEDYSASVSAILQRRASARRQSRRRHRRPSSPFSPDADSALSAGRRTSVFTTSSGDSPNDSSKFSDELRSANFRPAPDRLRVLSTALFGSTAISLEEGVTQEQIYENLRLHKEVLSSVKQQPWPMRRKLRLVQQAKAYVKKHEGELKERLAQSRTTRDLLSRFNILLVKVSAGARDGQRSGWGRAGVGLKSVWGRAGVGLGPGWGRAGVAVGSGWGRAGIGLGSCWSQAGVKLVSGCSKGCSQAKRWQYMKRELANLVNVLIPWELRIKEIESHFGSVVASYFTFLRWLFWVNLVIAVLLAAFVAIPEVLAPLAQRSTHRCNRPRY